MLRQKTSTQKCTIIFSKKKKKKIRIISEDSRAYPMDIVLLSNAKVRQQIMSHVITNESWLCKPMFCTKLDPVTCTNNFKIATFIACSLKCALGFRYKGGGVHYMISYVVKYYTYICL